MEQIIQKFEINMEKCVISVNDEVFEAYIRDEEKPTFTNNMKEAFFWSHKDPVGTSVDSAAPIPVVVDGITIPNGELALHYFQIMFTGCAGDLELLKKIYGSGISFEKGQDYALKQSRGWLTFDQIRTIFEIPGEGKLASDDIESINGAMKSMGCSILFMTESQWESRPMSMKSEGESYLEFGSGGSEIACGYRFYSSAEHGGIFNARRKCCFAYWQCNVKMWDNIKGRVMELIFTIRATDQWLDNVRKQFPNTTRFIHLSPFDEYFAAKQLNDKRTYVGQDWQGKILTEIICNKRRSVDDILEEINSMVAQF